MAEPGAEFARILRGSVRAPGGLLLVGTPEHEPWHFAAHLDDESRLADVAPEALTVPLTFDAAQHLVSAAAGERMAGRRRLRARLARLPEEVSGPVSP